MSELDKTQVARIAKLARLKMDDERLQEMAGELNKILGFVEQLQAVNTDQVEPLRSVSQMNQPLREDVVNDGGYQHDILANAPEAAHGFFVVPKVVE